MIHHGERLPLLLEAGNHLPGIHPKLDDLQGHLTPDGPLLLSHPHYAEAAFSEPLQQLVVADTLSDFLLLQPR